MIKTTQKPAVPNTGKKKGAPIVQPRGTTKRPRTGGKKTM